MLVDQYPDLPSIPGDPESEALMPRSEEDLHHLPEPVRQLAIGRTWSIRDAVERIERTKHGIALVVDAAGRLLDTITDGDVRRGMLAGIGLDAPASELMSRREHGFYPKPITAPVGTDPADLLALMQEKTLRQIPLLDEDGRVADLVTMDMLLPGGHGPIDAVVMAGGAGARLQPLTHDTPKPMLPVGGRPLLEHIIARLKQADIHDISISTNYLAEQIEAHFGQGEDHDVNIRYLTEEEPRGTAGALALMPRPDSTVLVMNGDILTNVDFAAMLAFHREHNAAMTVAVRNHSIQIPYGVVECDGANIRRIVEKPTRSVFVNAGIYLLEPALWPLIPRDRHFDMTDLIEQARRDDLTVCAFPLREYWLDIGHLPDYEQAQRDVEVLGASP
jgi:dTDP-glucose pyrophosphorylase